MKKLLILITFICVSFAVSSFAVNPPIGTAISSAGYVAVTLPAGWSCTSYGITTADGSAYYIAQKADGSDGELFPEGFGYSIDEKVQGSTTGGILCYVKGTTTTRIVGIFKGYR